MMHFHHTDLQPSGALVNIYQITLGGGGAALVALPLSVV